MTTHIASTSTSVSFPTTQHSLVEKPAPEQQKLKPHLMSIPIPKQAARAYYFSQTYDGDDQAASVFFQVFGGRSLLPTILRQTIGEYIPDEWDECVGPLGLAQIKPTVQIERFVNLSDASILREHLRPAFKTEVYLKEALRLVTSAYEVPKRRVGEKGRCGYVFPMQPELMSWLMKNVSGKKVLEIGGADGKLGILFAYANAQKVFLNESDPIERRRYEDLLKGVSTPIKKKLQFIEASCFDLLKMNPNLMNEIDVLFCGNVIHFFNDVEQDAFFCLLDKVLKKDAIVVVTVNSAYASKDASIFEKYPDQTAYRCFQCFFSNPGITEVFIRESEPCSGDKISFNYTNVHVYSRKMGSQWKVIETQAQRLDLDMQKKIQAKIKEMNPKLKKIKKGDIFASTTHFRQYTTKTLQDLFEKQNYQVLSVHTVDGQGHLCATEEVWKRGVLNTIICRKS